MGARSLAIAFFSGITELHLRGYEGSLGGAFDNPAMKACPLVFLLGPLLTPGGAERPGDLVDPLAF
jgi:hypothetical protein